MKIKTAIILLLINCSLFAQQIKFNKIYSHNNSYPTNRNIVSNNNGYVLMGGAYVNWLGILVYFIDSLGNPYDYREYSYDGYSYYHGVENSLKQLPNNEYILGGSYESSYSDTSAAILIKFDSNFDTLWTHKYLTDTFQRVVYGASFTKLNEYLLTGFICYDNSINSDMLLIKADSNGNMLWYKTYGNNLPNHGYKVTETWDNGYLVGGWTNIGGTYTTNSGEWYLVKTDSIGNLKWQKNLGNPGYSDGRVAGLISTKDSCYIVTGAYATGMVDYSTVTRGRVVKIDTYGNIKWDKKYDYNGFYGAIISVLEQENGNIITLGMADSVYTIVKHAVLQKLTPDGDLIWRKRIWFMCDSLNCYPSNNSSLESLIQTNDGGFAMAGWVNDINLTPKQQMWVVKTDSLGNYCIPDSGEFGCLTIVSVEEIPTNTGIANLLVFPNPSSGSITVDIQKPVNEKTNIEITDINGLLIYSDKLPQQQTKQNIDISGFSKGIYFVTVRSSSFIETRKLIIQ